MRSVKPLLSIMFFFAFAIPVRAQPADTPCNQVDQAEQTRCQIAKAITSHNNTLVRRIFDTSVYADVNDAAACGGGGYMGCAINASNLEIAQYLFSRGFDPNWRVRGNYPLVATPIDLGPFGQKDDFVVAVFGLFMEKQAELDVPIPAAVRSGPQTVLNFLMEKCWQPHQQYPRYNRLIQAAVEKNPSNKSLAMSSLAAVTQYSASHPRAGDIANCTDMYNWVRR